MKLTAEQCKELDRLTSKRPVDGDTLAALDQFMQGLPPEARIEAARYGAAKANNELAANLSQHLREE